MNRGALAAFLVTSAWAPAVFAGESGHIVEVAVFGGLAASSQPHGSAPVITERRSGGALAITSVYKTAYFLSPFLDFGVLPVAELHARAGAPDFAGPIDTTFGRSWAYGLTAGFALDFWRMRLSSGVGYFDVFVKSKVAGVTSLSNEIDFGYLFSARASLLSRKRFQVAFEVRAALIIDAQISVFAIGPSLAGDAFSF